MFKVFRDYPEGKVVYIAPMKALVRERMDDWRVRIQEKLGKSIVELTGDITPDVKAILKASVIVTTPEKWDAVSRSWQTRSFVQAVRLIVIDEIHLLGEDRGPVLEVIVSRTNFISSHTSNTLRIIGLSTALSNAKAKYVGSFVRSLERPATIAQFAYDIATENLDNDFYKTYLDKINAVTAEDVRDVAQKYFNVDQSRIVVTGKGVDVLDNLEKVEFNGKRLPVNYYDKYGMSIDRPKKVSVAGGITAETVLTNHIEKTGVNNLSDLSAVKLVYKGTFMQMAIVVEETYSADSQEQVISVGGNAMMTSVVSTEGAFMKQGPNKMDLPKVIYDDLKKSLGIIAEIGLLASGEAVLEGIETVNDTEAYVIKVPGVGVSYTNYYSKETGMKIKESTLVNFNGQMQTNNTNYANYKEISSLMMPGEKSFDLGGQEITLTLEDVIVNPD